MVPLEEAKGNQPRTAPISVCIFYTKTSRRFPPELYPRARVRVDVTRDIVLNFCGDAFPSGRALTLRGSDRLHRKYSTPLDSVVVARLRGSNFARQLGGTQGPITSVPLCLRTSRLENVFIEPRFGETKQIINPRYTSRYLRVYLAQTGNSAPWV